MCLSVVIPKPRSLNREKPKVVLVLSCSTRQLPPLREETSNSCIPIITPLLCGMILDDKILRAGQVLSIGLGPSF
jgi:hypothetical protein